MNSVPVFAELPSRSARRAVTRARRAERLPALFGSKRDTNAVLDKLSVMIVGVGAVGAVAARSLAHLQLGELRLVDRGCFKPVSLITQPITSREVGRPKAGAIGRLCKDISPRTRVLAFDGPLQQLPLADLTAADIIIVAGDNFSVLREAGQRCLRLGVKMIHAAVHGETLTAQCRTFGHAQATSPCPVCLFGAEEFRIMEEERVLSCDGFRRQPGDKSGRSLHVTASLQPLCGLAGTMAAVQAVKLALALGPASQDTLLEVCAYTWRAHVTPIRRNPACPCFHERYEIMSAPRSLRDCAVGELARAAGLGTDATPAIGVEGFHWVERGLCGCTESRPIHRFLRAGESRAVRCAKCRKSLHPQPFYLHDSLPASAFERFRARTLLSLGATDCRGALLQGNGRTVLLTNPMPKARS